MAVVASKSDNPEAKAVAWEAFLSLSSLNGKISKTLGLITEANPKAAVAENIAGFFPIPLRTL